MASQRAKSQKANVGAEEYSQQATIETLLKLIEKSSSWLKRMERDSLLAILLLIATPIVATGTLIFGPSKIAFLGDYLIPSAIFGIVAFLAFIAYLIRRHLLIRKEVQLWQERLQTLQRKTNELLSAL